MTVVLSENYTWRYSLLTVCNIVFLFAHMLAQPFQQVHLLLLLLNLVAAKVRRRFAHFGVCSCCCCAQPNDNFEEDVSLAFLALLTILLTPLSPPLDYGTQAGISMVVLVPFAGFLIGAVTTRVKKR